MTIQGKQRKQLTIENILNLISEFSIYSFYMSNRNWKLNVATLSPFQQENSPSFIIGTKYGKLTHYAFNNSKFHGDCFHFVKQLYNLNTINDVLIKIDQDFQLGFVDGNNTQEYKKIVENYKQPEELGKRYSLIQCITRKFTHEELSYWNLFHQDISDLRRENIYSLKKVYLNKQLFSHNETELRFGYLYGTNWKIYKPFANKRNKWVPNNVPITTLEGKEDVQNCEIAFINKSKKDKMVIRKIFSCTCAVQHEGIACFSTENVEYLKENSKRQILSFDSDVPGVENSQQITKQFGFEYLNVPKKYLIEGINDWAALAKEYSLQTIEDIFKQKKLI